MPAGAENSSDRAANFDKLTPTGETTGQYHAGRPFFILAISAARRPPKEKLSMGDVPIYFSTYRLRHASVRTFSLRKDPRMKGEANL